MYISMYHVFFIHSSFDGHLVCVHVLAIVNTAPGGLLDPGIEPRSPALQAEALTSEPVGQTPSGVRVSFGIMVFSGCTSRGGIVGSYF